MSCFGCFKLGCNANVNFDREVHNILCPVREWKRLRDGIGDLKTLKSGVESAVATQLTEPLVEVRPEVTSWKENVDGLAKEVDDEEVTQNVDRLPREVDDEEVTQNVDRLPREVDDEEVTQNVDRLPREVDDEEVTQNVDRLPREVDDEEVTQNVDSLGRRATRWSCLSLCCCFSNYKLGEEVTQKLLRVEELKRQHEVWKDNLVRRMAPPRVEEVLHPSCSSSLIGAEDNFAEVLAYVKDDTHQVIGMYGMGGMGKTALLREINNYYLENMDQQVDFDLLIWVVVSQDVDIYKIQKDIGKRLGFGVGAGSPTLPDDKHDRARTLWKALSQKKFLLMLDDVWKPLDLSEVGISIGKQNKSKVILTTRKEDVCIDMGADKWVKLRFLNKDSSQHLFRHSVRNKEIFENEKICSLAKEIVKKCGGLPLALLTVGRAMANKSEIVQWRDATVALDHFPSNIRGMEEHVLKLLKFSFDNLADDKMRSCLLFCCLFREDEEINTEELANYWMGEGLLLDGGEQNSLESLRANGRNIISNLREACLLEEGTEFDNTVKMHDAVHDMGIWLGKGGGDGSYDHRFACFPDKGREEIIISDEWLQLERISLAENDIKGHLSFCADRNNEVPDCGKLVTLLAGDNHRLSGPQLDRLSQFFTPSLRVLHLAYTAIDHLPTSPPSLKALRWLDLSGTGIQELDLDNLPNLKILCLHGTIVLVSISKSEISNPNLQCLDLSESRYNILKEEKGQLTLEDLEAMHELEELRLSVIECHQYKHRLEKLWRSARLSKSTRHLEIDGNWSLTVDDISMAMRTMRNLEVLILRECPRLEEEHIEIEGDQLQHLTELFVWGLTLKWEAPAQRLTRLLFVSCPTLKNIAWVVQLPCLEFLVIDDCGEIEELLLEQPYAEGETDTTNSNNHHIFSKLREIRLLNLPTLKRISPTPLILPSLASVMVSGCPLLKTISQVQNYMMDDKSKSHGNSSRTLIQCARGWWEALEWNHDDTKSSWSPLFNQDE